MLIIAILRLILGRYLSVMTCLQKSLHITSPRDITDFENAVVTDISLDFIIEGQYIFQGGMLHFLVIFIE